MKRMLFAVAVLVLAGSAYAQTTRPRALYKLFRFTPTTLGIACQNGNKPFVTDAPRGSDLLVVSCADTEK